MIFFAVFMQKLAPPCNIGAFSAAIFRKALFRKWPPLVLSLSQYLALFVDIMSTRRCGTPVLEKRSCSSSMEVKSRRYNLTLAKIRGFPEL